MAGSKPLGTPIDIATHRQTARNRVRSIGVELEGGWNTLPARCSPPIRDGSVHVLADYIGEYPSPVLSFDPESPKYWKKWVTKMYPHVVDHTCGMHVHLSFNTAFHYQRLMSPDYPATIVAEIKRWALSEGLPPGHCLWGRLGGQSQFCQHVFHADEQVSNPSKDYDQQRVGHRYTVINYCWRNSTLECRLLPMMPDLNWSLKAIQEVVDITNGYLVASRAREKRFRAELEMWELSEMVQENSVVKI